MPLAASAAGVLVAFSGLCATAAARVTHFPSPHQHLVPPTVTGNAPGLEAIPLTLPAPSYNVSTQSQLSAALQSASPGQVIHLASGSSFNTVFDDTARRGWVTVSGAGDAVAPTIAGVNLEGSQFLRFTGVEFTSRVFIARSPTKGTSQPAENIQILNSEVNCGSSQTGGSGSGVAKTVAFVVRQASENVTVGGDFVHNCTLGFTTAPSDSPTQNLTLIHNLFEYFYGDAIDLGGNSNTTIADNIIQDIHHSPGVVYHDDGIQFFGNTNNTLIQNNVLDNSDDQLIFIQDAIAGQTTGIRSNSNITVDHDLIYGAGASAVQDEGGVNVHFTHDTVWDSNDIALVLRPSPYTGNPPTGTVVQDDIVPTYMTLGGAVPQVEDDNLIEWPIPHKSYGPDDILGVTPQFVSSPAGDFAIVAGTTGSGIPGATSPATATSGTGSPMTLTGSAAATAGLQLGADPQNIPYGAPLFGN